MAREWDEVFDLGADPAPARRGGGVRRGGATERGGVFRRLRENLARSREALTAEVSSSFFDRLDAEAFERLEEALILADVGAPVTAEVVGKLEAEVTSGAVGQGEAARTRLVELLAEVAAPHGPARIDLSAKPAVVMVVGVNGTGKTTTIGKLAQLLRSAARPADDRRGGRHLPRGGDRAARDLGGARGSRDRPRPAGRRSRRGGLRLDRGGRGARGGRRDRRHGRPPAHPRQPDGGAREGQARRSQAARGRAARDPDRDRRDHRARTACARRARSPTRRG